MITRILHGIRIRLINVLRIFHDIPEWKEVQDHSEEKENNKCKPGEERNAKVEGILYTFKETCQAAKIFLLIINLSVVNASESEPEL